MAIPHFDGSVEGWLVMAGLFVCGGVLLWFGQRLESPALTGLGALGVAATLLWAGPALAAQAGEDLEALAARAKARGEESARTLAPWVQTLKTPTEAQSREAPGVAAGQGAALRRGALHLDDPTMRDALTSTTPGVTGPAPGAVYVAVSLSMPPEALRVLGRDAEKAGVRLVLRGPTEGSFKATALKVRAVFDQRSAAGVAIDPKVFRAFGVTAAPTFVAATGEALPCGTLDCTPKAPGFDKVAGNISLEAALTALAEAGGPGAPAAAAALKRLRG